MPLYSYAIPVGLILGGCVVFWKAFQKLRLKKAIEGLATSKIRSVAMGLAEVSGRAIIHQDILDPIFNKPCAHFHISVDEERSTGSGKERRTTWVNIYHESSEKTPFICEDETGRLLVDPLKGEVSLANVITGHGLGFWDSITGKSNEISRFMSSVKGVGGRRRINAHILRPGDPVFILGCANPVKDEMRKANLNAIIGQSDEHGLHIASSEQQVLGAMNKAFIGSLFMAAVLIVGGFLVFAHIHQAQTTYRQNFSSIIPQ